MPKAMYQGQCQCGAVKVSVEAGAVAVRQCWCRQCQQVAGGGATHNALFPTDACTITGDLATSSYVAASGNTLTRSFCPACGTPVMAKSSARPHFTVVRLGMLDQPNDLRPQMVIWTDDAPDWAVIDPTLEQHPRQPPAPPPAS